MLVFICCCLLYLTVAIRIKNDESNRQITNPFLNVNITRGMFTFFQIPKLRFLIIFHCFTT